MHWPGASHCHTQGACSAVVPKQGWLTPRWRSEAARCRSGRAAPTHPCAQLHKQKHEGSEKKEGQESNLRCSSAASRESAVVEQPAGRCPAC